MIPQQKHITIDDNVKRIRQFIDEVIVQPKHTLLKWAEITNQTPAAKIGYIGQHIASLITGVRGTGSGARGDDLEDGSEIKSCNKVDQADKCRNCGNRVMRFENVCSNCGSSEITRKDDSKWLFSVRDEHELKQYEQMSRVILLLMDYPGFAADDFRDIRICAFEIYPQEERMSVFNTLLSNHYHNIYLPKLEANKHTSPMNLHPWSFQFYKCNPIKTFECIIRDVDTRPEICIDEQLYVSPSMPRNSEMSSLPMPTSLLRDAEWDEMLRKSRFKDDVLPLLVKEEVEKLERPLLTKKGFMQLPLKQKQRLLPEINEMLRNRISLRPIVSVQQKEHYQR